MSLSDRIKTDIRRHLRFPAAGNPSANNTSGQVTTGAASMILNPRYNYLERKLEILSPSEESILTGAAYGAIVSSGPSPKLGDTITVVISEGGLSSPVTVNAAAYAGITTPMQLMAVLAAECNKNTNLAAKGIIALAPWGSGPFGGNVVTNPQMALVAPREFTLSVTTIGTIGAAVTDDGTLPEPSFDPGRSGDGAIHGYIPICNYLQGQIARATKNMDIHQAGDFTARSNETKKRQELYDLWCNELAAFLGVPRYMSRKPSGYMTL